MGLRKTGKNRFSAQLNRAVECCLKESDRIHDIASSLGARPGGERTTPLMRRVFFFSSNFNYH